MRLPLLVTTIFIFISTLTQASTGKWYSPTVQDSITYKVTEAHSPITDVAGNYVTIVYLENVNINKLSCFSNKKNVRWLLAQGYRVIELNYLHAANTVSPFINTDITAINKAIASSNFCGITNSSHYQSYVLFEGYRIERNITYFIDNPLVYNTPKEYITGDPLHMDIIYPAGTKTPVPVILSFSYSNSYATYDSDKKMLVDTNKDQRLKLEYTLAGFKDSFLEGAPANGIAWAIADHPKYCSWGKGKPENGPNDAYKSYETNPDTAQKVKSAVRTLRALGENLNLSGEIGIYGFSRGSTAGSMAIGDRTVTQFTNAGLHQNVKDNVQVAALGPGVFDYTIIYKNKNDGDGNMETRCPQVWGPLKTNKKVWNTMGAYYLVETRATAPTLFFYNTTDEAYYQKQVQHLKQRLDALGVYTQTVINYGKGHSVPQTDEALTSLYNFFKKHFHVTGTN